MKATRTILGAVCGLALSSGAWGASFLEVKDTTGDGAVNVSIFDTKNGDMSKLVFALNGGSWGKITTFKEFEGLSDGTKIALGLSSTGDLTPELTLDSAMIVYSDPQGNDSLSGLWGTVSITWAVQPAYHFTLATAASLGEEEPLEMDAFRGPAAPVPLPGAALLLGSGLAGLGIFGRRKRE